MVCVGTAATGGSTDGVTIDVVAVVVVQVMMILVLDVVGVVMSVVVGAVGTTAGVGGAAAAAVVVFQLHLCQRVLMSQAGGSGRRVVVPEALVVVRVLFEGGRGGVRVLQGTQTVVAGVLAHVVHLDVRLGLGR